MIDMDQSYTAGPLVSIGVPAYNRPDSLDRAITCLREQTWPNLEIIISDNASSDARVAEVIAAHAEQDRRIKVFLQPKNIGPLKNFSFVLEKAAADYFLWAADDDWCTPDFIEKLLSPLVADPGLVLVAADVDTVNGEGVVIRVNELDSIRQGAEWSQARKLFFRYPTSNIFFCIYGLYRTEVLRNVGIEQSAGYRGLTSHAEVPFLAQIATHGRIVSIPEKLKFYTSHQNSVYYSELAQITPRAKFRLNFGIRTRLLQIGWRANLPLLSRLGLIFVVLQSWVKSVWNDINNMTLRKLARVASHCRDACRVRK